MTEPLKISDIARAAQGQWGSIFPALGITVPARGKKGACPVCGGTHLKRVMTCTDFYASGEQFELYSCEDCGFTFTQGVPVEAEIGKYYETPDYISHTDTRKGAMNTCSS